LAGFSGCVKNGQVSDFEAILNAIRSRMYPGTVLVTVDETLSADTRSSKDFLIMTTGDDA
jgi:hypothetical protein